MQASINYKDKDFKKSTSDKNSAKHNKDITPKTDYVDQYVLI